MKVLALTRYGRLGASSRLRIMQYVPALAEQGIEVEVVPLFHDDYIEAINSGGGRLRPALSAYFRRLSLLMSRPCFDLLWIEKEALPWLPFGIERSLLGNALPFVLDYDDAVFHRYDRHSSPIIRRLLGRKLDRLMAQAALVVAGNDYLASRAERAGAPNVAIVPTVVDLARYDAPPRAHHTLPRIGWIGSPSTAVYLEPLKPVLDQLAASHEFEAVAVGARPEQVAGSRFTASAWSETSEVADLCAMDIGIMPLADSPWEQGKCGYKLIQYMAVGVPVIGSPVGANRSILSDGREGLWASASSEWLQALHTMLANPALRSRFGSAGRETVETRYSLAVTAPLLADLLVKASGRRT